MIEHEPIRFDATNLGQTLSLIFPPIDAVEDFREQTTDADARYGRAAGGVINLVFKSGTSHFHGEVFEFLRNSALDAKNYFDTGAKPPFRMNTFGATFGRPLFRGKNPKTFSSWTMLANVPARDSRTSIPFRCGVRRA